MGTLLMLIAAVYMSFPGPTAEQLANGLAGYVENASAHRAIIVCTRRIIDASSNHFVLRLSSISFLSFSRFHGGYAN